MLAIKPVGKPDFSVAQTATASKLALPAGDQAPDTDDKTSTQTVPEVVNPGDGKDDKGTGNGNPDKGGDKKDPDVTESGKGDDKKDPEVEGPGKGDKGDDKKNPKPEDQTQAPTDNKDSTTVAPDSDMSSGMKVLIALGVIALLGVLVALIWFFCCRGGSDDMASADVEQATPGRPELVAMPVAIVTPEDAAAAEDKQVQQEMVKEETMEATGVTEAAEVQAPAPSPETPPGVTLPTDNTSS